MKKFLLLLAALFITVYNTVIGQGFLVEDDLRLNWVFYSEDEQVMLPFLDNSDEDPVAIHLSMENEYAKDAYLLIDTPSKTSLFINNRFLKYYEDPAAIYLRLDSLRNKFREEKLNLSLYRKESFEKPANARIGFIHRTFESTVNVNPIAERDLDNTSDYLQLIILAIFTFFVVLHTLFPSDLMDALSLSTLITFRYTDTTFTKYRSITKTQILVIVYQAALLSGTAIIFFHYYHNPLGDVFFLRINPILGWLVVFAIVLVLIFLKLVLISIISILFGLSDSINFYFLEFLRMSMIFYSILFVVISYLVINLNYLLITILESFMIIVIIFNIIRFLILFFKFRRTVTIKSLHLFSYLCTTEMIPIILGLKFFLK